MTPEELKELKLKFNNSDPKGLKQEELELRAISKYLETGSSIWLTNQARLNTPSPGFQEYILGAFDSVGRSKSQRVKVDKEFVAVVVGLLIEDGFKATTKDLDDSVYRLASKYLGMKETRIYEHYRTYKKYHEKDLQKALTQIRWFRDGDVGSETPLCIQALINLTAVIASGCREDVGYQK